MSKLFELLPDIFAEHYAKYVGVMPAEMDLTEGVLIDSPPEVPMRYETNYSAAIPPRGYMDMVVPVMSVEFINALKQSGVSNLQCFPAVLTSNVDGSVWTNYQAVNIIGTVKCADLSRSEYQKIISRSGSGAIPLLGFSLLKVKSSAAGNATFFRLAEAPGIILVNDSLVQSLLAMKTAEDWGLTFIDRS